MYPFLTVWFWLLVISIVLFIVAFVFLEIQAPNSAGNIEPAPWIWAMFGLAIGIFTVTFICYIIYLNQRRVEPETKKHATSPPRLTPSSKSVSPSRVTSIITPSEPLPMIPPSPRRVISPSPRSSINSSIPMKVAPPKMI